MSALLHSPWLVRLGWALLHLLWEGTLLVLATALLLRLLRGRSPRLRYVVAVLALLGMALLPLRRLGASPSTPPVVTSVRGNMEAAGSRAGPGTASLQIATLRTRAVAGLERTLPSAVTAWALGAMACFLRLAGGWAWLQRLRWRRSELAPDVLQGRLLDLCRRAGLRRAVTLLSCTGLAGPSVVGFLRPAILVPTGWFLNLAPDHVEALLAHELAHVLRHDYAVNLLQSLLEVLLFYHPGVWWLSRRIRAERELASDAFAVRLLGDPLPLAEALTYLERRGLGRPLEPAPAAHGGSLMERISHLLLPHPRTASAPAFGALALLALLMTAGLHLGAQVHDPTPAVAPAVPQGNRPGVTALYLRSRNALDAAGKDIPYTQLWDIKADQVPLNQAWEGFESLLDSPRPDKRSQSWAARNGRIPGPRVNLDLEGATSADVLAVFNHLAQIHGVDPYQAAPTTELGPFSITRNISKDGRMLFNLHARQVSPDYLDKLLAEAARLQTSGGTWGGTATFAREADTATGPRVDAIFEALSLEELQIRVRKLQAETK
jgi:beta-lactamase regulating signal transducer with metallopeptidase domain